MSQELSIKITAQDGASQVFRQIADASAKVADHLQEAGTKGAQGLNQTTAAAKSTSAALEETRSRATSLKAEATAIGAVFGVVAAGVAKAGAAFRDQQRSVDAINRLYGDSSKRVLEFADSMQDLTNVSDDAARQSAILMNTLQQNYQFTGDEIEQLIMRSADLAELHGKSFLDVSQMVQNALRGEAEYIEQIGVTLNDNFVAMEASRRGIEGWTTTMSDAEKAAFRFQLLMEQTANAQGYAIERASGGRGFVRDLVDDFQDATQAVGGFLGPIGQVAAELAPIAVAAPIAGAGIGRMVASLKESAVASNVARVGLAGVSAVASPLGLVLTGVVAIGGLLAASWLEQRAAAQAYNQSLSTLDGTLESVRRRGDTALAALGESAEENLGKVKKALEDYNGADLRMPQPSDFTNFDTREQDYAKALTEYEEAIKQVQDQAAKAQPVIDLFNEALNDPNINAKAYLEWANGLLAVAASTDGTADDLRAIQTILSTPLSTFSFSKMAADLDKVKASASEVRDVFKDFPATLDDLRIDGKSGLATQLDSLHTGIIKAFTPSEQEVMAANAGYLRMLPSEDAEAAVAGLTSHTDLSAASAEKLDTVWGRIQQKMSSGNLDNAKVMADVFAILNDTSLGADEKVAELEKLSLSMAQYIDRFAQLKDAQVDWLANGDNFLAWWQSYQQTMLDASAGVAEAGEAWLQFREDVDIAAGVEESGRALDQVLRTFGEIDSLGQRSASAGSIADKLIGAPGELGELQDLWDRISAGTSDAVLAQEDYNNAINAGIAIQESNVRVQDDLNVVRAKQMPLLQQEQAAYEANIERIASLNAVEARRVLLLQDTAVQSQVAALYSQAYAAAIGEVPKDVTTKMILEAAEADAGLKDLLLNLGLIQKNSDGTISVNFPDAESVGHRSIA